ARVKDNRVQTHAARPGLPLRPGAMAAKAGQFLPVLSAIGGAKNRRVFHSCINCLWVGQRRFQMPYPLELPWMLRAVVPLMRRQWPRGIVVGELVAFAFRRTGHHRLSGGRSRLVPGFSAVVRA